MYRYLLILFTVLCFSVNLYASPKLIAVLDLVNKTQKFKVDEIYFLTDLIRKTAILIEKDDISVITKDNILQLLPPDKTLEECINECAIKTGQLLGADWIVTGQVIEFGESYRVSISLYTKAGILEEQQTISGAKIEDLEKALKEASIKLFSKIDPNIMKDNQDSDLSFQGKQLALDVPKITINQGQMSQINLEAEKLLETALDVEEKKTSTPKEKMQAWCKLSMTNSAYQEQALVACQNWSTYVRDYESNLIKIKEDFKTLAGYLQLKRKTTAQKKSAISSFVKTYQTLASTPEYKTANQFMELINQGKDIVIDLDQDGIADQNDQCPEVAEDKDGFKDDDGCLDADNDQDSVLDVNDKCPNQLEDKDNYEDEDGCPEFGPIDIEFLDQKMHSFYLSYTPTTLNVGGTDVGSVDILGLNYHVKTGWFEYSLSTTFGTNLSFISILYAPYLPNEHYFGINLVSWPHKSKFSPINLSLGVSMKFYFLANIKSSENGNYCLGLVNGIEDDECKGLAKKGAPFYPGFYIRNVIHLGCSYMASITLNNTPVHLIGGKMNNGEDMYMTSISLGFGWTFGSRCD